VSAVARIVVRSSAARRVRIAAILVCIALLAGCSAMSPVKRVLGIGPDRPALRALKLSADGDANRGNATQVDIVVAYSERAEAALPKTGPDWFRQRESLRSAFPKDLAVVSLEVPAPTPEFEIALPKGTRNDGLAVYAFANYAAKEGWPAIGLTRFKRVALRLGATSIAVVEDK
jgi:type VI secretion system protein